MASLFPPFPPVDKSQHRSQEDHPAKTLHSAKPQMTYKVLLDVAFYCLRLCVTNCFSPLTLRYSSSGILVVPG